MMHCRECGREWADAASMPMTFWNEDERRVEHNRSEHGRVGGNAVILTFGCGPVLDGPAPDVGGLAAP